MTEVSDSNYQSPPGIIHGLGLAELFEIVRGRAVLVGAWTVAGLLVSMALAFSIVPTYESTASVLIDPREHRVIDIEAVLSGLKTDTPTIESEVEIVRSRAIARRVIEKLQLARHPDFAGGISAGGDDAQIYRIFASRLTAARRRNTYIIEISFRSSDGTTAKTIANAVAEAYIQDQIDAKGRANEQAATWLEQRVEVLRERLFAVEHDVEAYKNSHNLVESEGFRLDQKQLARLMEQMIGARADTAGARAKYDLVQDVLQSENGEGTIVDVLQNNTITALKSQLAKASRKRAELRTRYGQRHPLIRKADADVTDARAQLSSEIKRIVSNLKNEYHVARTREKSLQSSLERLKQNSGIANEDSVKLRELERRATANRQVYETFLRRYQETVEQRGFQLPDARIVEAAIASPQPSSPGRKRIAVMGLALGFAMGLVFALGLELVAPTQVRARQVEARFGLAHLATLPVIDSHYGGADNAVERLRLMVTAPQANFVNELRILRGRIDLLTRSGSSKTIMMVSAQNGDGKSTTSSNLAHQYAMTGLRTLLIDGDRHDATLTAQFTPNCRYGLLDALNAGASLRPAIVKDNRTGLHFLPIASPMSPHVNGSELLASPRMVQAMNELRAMFDVIIVDTPSAATHMDARILTRHVDMAAFVMSWRDTPSSLALKVIDDLHQFNCRLVGIVVNKVQRPPAALQVDTSRAGASTFLNAPSPYYSPRRGRHGGQMADRQEETCNA